MLALGPCLLRAVDPTKMTEREKRNTIEEPDLYTNAEFLVYGGFREDEDDDGFYTVRWLPAEALEGITDRVEALDHLAELLRTVRASVFDDVDF